MSTAVHRGNASDAGTRILEITAALAAQLHGTPAPDLDLDSSLDRDFGLESLARAELLQRIEQEFGIELSDAMLTAAERPRDLVQAVLAIVGFGTVVERPWAENGMVGARRVIHASLAGDHRVSDGHRGGLFLRAIGELLQKPEQL